MTDDAQLLRQYVETRSEAAFSELVRRHLGIVYHVAVRQLGSERHLAEDVAQAVFVVLARKSRALLGHTSLAGWLHATTHYKVARTLRTERRRQLRETAALTMKELLPDPAVEEWEQIRPMLDDVLLELNASDREAVLLRFFENCPFAEIGARLQLTESAAHKRVERALEKLRERLARRGAKSSAAALAVLLDTQAAPAAPAGLAAVVTGAVVASGLPIALGGLTLMSMKITAGLCALSLLAGGLVTYEVQTKRAEFDRPAARDAAVAVPAGLPVDEGRIVNQQAAVPPSLPPPSAAIPPGAATIDDAPLRNFTRQDQATIEKRFGKFLRQLTDSEAEALRKLLLLRLNIAVDLTASAAQSGGPTRQSDPVGFAAAENRAKAEIDAQISELLGPDGFAAYQAADKDWRSQDTVNNLQKILTASGVPLTTAQGDTLQEALTKPGTLQFGVRQITDEVITGAEAYLSPEQLAGLRQLQRKEQETVKAKLLLKP